MSNSAAKIYVITGVMASGKSTVAQLLTERFDRAVHLRGDVFRRMIVSGREEMSDRPSDEAVRQLELRYSLTADAAKGYLAAGFNVVVQDNYLGEMLPRFVALLAPAPVEVVVLCPDAATVARREAARGKTGYVGFTVEEMHAGFLQTTPRVGLWLDTSNDTPEETVERILGRLA